MDGSGASRRRLVLAGVLLAVGILVHDLLRPLGVAGGVPYIAVVLVSWWMPQQRAAIILGIGCTMLTIVGFALSPKIGPMWELVTSRMLAIFAIWMVTMLCLQHKRAEVALRESEELFSLFMRHLPGLATMKDENHRISYLNETFEETFGISRNEWIGKTVDEVFPPETASRLRENDQWVLSNGRALKVTEDMQQADGVHHYLTYRFPIRRPGRPTVLGGVSVDLTEQIRAEQALQRAHNELERKVEERTADLVAINVQLQEEVAERKRTEEALRASEQLHTKAQQIAHLGHWERNFATNQDTWSRESYCIFGVDDDGGEGDSRGLLAQVHPDDAPLVESAIAAARDDGSPMDMDYRIIRPDRTERFVHTLAEVRRDERGQATSLVGTVQDITERKKAEKRIQRQQDELAHLSRLSTLGEMGTGLAHELNQPLASIVSYTQGCIRRIRDGKTEQSDLIAALASVTSEAERAGEIIRRIRRFIRKREPQQTRVEPAELIEQCLALVRHELQAEGVALDVQVGKDLPCIDADRIQLQQVILNLLRNSMEAMEAVDRSNRAITVRAFLRQDGSLTVAIRDTGSGIAAGEAEKVFEPFYTTKTEGTGMGLAISRTIIEAHGGWLSAQANPDGGSTFEFTLPADRSSA